MSRWFDWITVNHFVRSPFTREPMNDLLFMSHIGIWPFNENAMMDKVVRPSFSSTATTTNDQSMILPTNMLMPQPVVPSMPLSSIMISPLKLVITSYLRSISPASAQNTSIADDTSNTAEQTLLDIQRIVPIQPTLIDDHDIPSATHSTFAVLETVDVHNSTFEPQTSIHAQPTPMDVTVSSSTDSPGTQLLAILDKKIILFSRRESWNQRQNSNNSFHRCRATSLGISVGWASTASDYEYDNDVERI